MMKIKVVKKKINKKCSICHKPLRTNSCEMWWETKGQGETFHHFLHISCCYVFLKKIEKPKKEHIKFMEMLENKYTKELMIDKLK